ncbi:MAG: hypothetical protein IJN13_05480 [Bacilli bacterium]|nr:hypothetical protein [Bacilli bacterium]
MDRRTLVEFITGWILVLAGGIMTILPIFSITNVRMVFIAIIAVYGIIHLIKNFFILEAKDFSGFRTAASCIVALILMMFMDINDSPWNLALILFIWVILMSLTKLKESDYYHDRKNKLWELNVINLILFILTGVLTSVNLYYTGDVQILVLGFFFLINGILELMDPLAAYIMEKK